MIKKGFKSDLVDLFVITDMKRVKADEAGHYLEADELSLTQDYLEDAISKEFNFEWN